MKRRNFPVFCTILSWLTAPLLLAPVPLAAQETIRFRHEPRDRALDSVFCMLQDSRGLMWYGTQDGLYRFDAYQLTGFRAEQESGLPHNTVQTLALDNRERMWVGTRAGLVRFDVAAQRLVGEPQDDGDIRALLAGQDGGMWVGRRARGLSYRTASGSYRDVPLPDAGEITLLAREDQDRIWVGTAEAGLFQIDAQGRVKLRLSVDGDSGLQSNAITAVLREPDGRLWVGTQNGLHRLDPGARRFVALEPTPLRNDGLSHAQITALLLDGQGQLWVGGLGGLNLRLDEQDHFTAYTYQAGQVDGLSHNGIQTMLEDRSGVIWLGTLGGGLNSFSSGGISFEHIHRGGEPDVENASVYAILDTRDGDAGYLWLGGNTGLERVDADGTVTRVAGIPRNTRVRALAGDQDGDLWVGAYGSGLFHLKRDGQVETWFQNQDGGEGFVIDLLLDPSERLWVTRSDQPLTRLVKSDGVRRVEVMEQLKTQTEGFFGPLVLDPRNRIWSGGVAGLMMLEGDRPNTWPFGEGEGSRFRGNGVIALHMGFQNRLWIGTLGGGVYMMDVFSGLIRPMGRDDETRGMVVDALMEDDRGLIWAAAGDTLVRIDPSTGFSRRFGRAEGLPRMRFHQRAAAQGGSRFSFGGDAGLVSFQPARVMGNPFAPTTLITDLLLDNEPVETQAQDPRSPLNMPITHLEHLYLPVESFVELSLTFAAQHYQDPQALRYQYRLEGHDDDWLDARADQRTARYSNLPPRNYTFRVRAGNKDGVWDQEGTRLFVHVQYPLWRRWWALLLYGLLGGLAVFLGRMAYKRFRDQSRTLERERKQVAKEHDVAERLRHLDKMKDEFLANTSHELRTPLHGIIGLAESLIGGATGKLPRETVSNLNMIVSSGRRLANMVDDILDFSRLKSGSLELVRGPVDLSALTDVVINLLRPLTRKKNVALVHDVPVHLPAVDADENRLQQILVNLIGNALKFTHQGSVIIQAERRDKMVAVSVKDTGIGIPADKLEAIFESFSQSDGGIARVYGGSGLGLAITRQLVGLHDGEITVASVEGEGSTFTFTLPVSDQPAAPLEGTEGAGGRFLIDQEKQGVADTGRDEDVAYGESLSDDEGLLRDMIADLQGAFRILIVDDGPVNRQVLRNYLSLLNYDLVEAGDGTEALDALEEQGPFDLILLDIMMPGMSGYETCRKIRARYPSSELPVIFLSAKNQTLDLVHGFAAGANDYLTKPVAKNELLARVRTHLALLDINRRLEQKVNERTRELRTINDEILRTQKKVVTREKMASLGTITAGVAHEIKNPLNFINNFAAVSRDLSEDMRARLEEVASRLPEDVLDDFRADLQDLSDNAERIRKHGNRADYIVKNMMEISRSDTGSSRRIDLNELIREFTALTLKDLAARPPALDVRIIEQLEPSVGEVMIVPGSFSRVIVNLVTNAVEALRDAAAHNSAHQAQLSLKSSRDARAVTIQIEDNGSGIPAGVIDQVMTPFFTTKPADSGNIGLGLSLSFEIIGNEHGGDLRIESQEGVFTRVVISLPNSENRTPPTAQNDDAE